jgi:hypothetical protein
MSKGLLVFSTLFLLVFFAGCKVQYVPVEHTEYVTVRDSVYLRDTTIQYKIEKEYVRDYTGLLDTLDMETSYATARAWVDTSKAVLAGEIKNKENVINIPVQVKEKVTVRDSIVYQDRPVPVEVIKTVHPGYEKWLWGWLVLSVVGLGVFVYLWGKRKHIW